MQQLRAITRLVDDVLGPTALGTYLHGSAVHGELRPASDLDVLVVAARRLDDGERRALAGGLLRLSGPGAGGRSIELTVVVQADVRPWRYPPTADFLYGDWLREQIETDGPPPTAPMPNLAIMIPITLAGNRPLAGPPPAELLDPVPPGDVRRGSLDGIAELLGDLPGDTRNVVLTLARVWVTLATGEIMTKDAAADWALARLAPEHRSVLAHARRLYLTCRYTEESWSPELRSLAWPQAQAILANIRALAAGGRPR